MNGVVAVMCLVIPGCSGVPGLDKTGTTGCAIGSPDQQPRKNNGPADAGPSDTERAGFEPAVQFDPYAALAKRCFRPLSHLSDLPSKLYLW